MRNVLHKSKQRLQIKAQKRPHFGQSRLIKLPGAANDNIFNCFISDEKLQIDFPLSKTLPINIEHFNFNKKGKLLS